MQQFNQEELKNLRTPSPQSHKGENGKVMVIGGSQLFHAASLWALEIASKIVDMVFYASVPQNNEIVEKQKIQWRAGIIVPRGEIDAYISESDAILIGPGMVRTEKPLVEKDLPLQEILNLSDEGEQTYYLTQYVLKKYPDKKWVIDAGALQMMELSWLDNLYGNAILTPHQKEFERVFQMSPTPEHIQQMAKEHKTVLLVKEHEDVVCSPEECVRVQGGNAGMTKGGTGDVLAGLTAALAAQNEDLYLVAKAASYINKKTGDKLFEKVGYYFNATDLVSAIPGVMKDLLLS